VHSQISNCRLSREVSWLSIFPECFRFSETSEHPLKRRANYPDATELSYGHDKILHVFTESFHGVLRLHVPTLRCVLQIPFIYMNMPPPKIKCKVFVQLSCFTFRSGKSCRENSMPMLAIKINNKNSLCDPTSP